MPASASRPLAAAAPDAGARGAAPTAPPPIPAAPAGADPELVRIAGSLCAAAYRVDDRGHVEVGCRRPPPFTGALGGPDGTIPRHTGDPYTFCGFTVTHRGAFRTAGASELVLAWDNCHAEGDDAGWNGSLPGSTMLVTEEGDRFRQVAFLPGTSGRCRHARRPDGRAALLCDTRYDAATVGSVTTLYAIDFAAEERRVTVLGRLYDEAGQWACEAHDPQAVLLPDGLAALRVVGVTLTDANRDGVSDLVVDVERAYVAPSAALETRARAACAKAQAVTSLLPAPVRQRLELTSRGGSWQAAPASQRVLDAWRAQSPNVHQLDGSGPATN